jgi:hypothetical protein
VGAAYLFHINGTLVTTFTNPAPALRNNFGFRLAAVGTDKVVTGSFSANTGVAYLFDTNGTMLTAFANPVSWGADLFR